MNIQNLERANGLFRNIAQIKKEINDISDLIEQDIDLVIHQVFNEINRVFIDKELLIDVLIQQRETFISQLNEWEKEFENI